ncbi:MAG: hypothetical protein ACI85O_003640 [Saprospiraceae bacterium]|jgi:hypothetical protein
MKQTFLMVPEADFNAMNAKLDTILMQLSSTDGFANTLKNDASIIGGKWVPEKKAQEITGRKGTTLWKMRQKGLLTYTRLNNHVYYDMKSILALLDDNKKEAYR